MESKEINKRLFAVMLGGRAPKCNTELHDVVFAVGETIEDTYWELMMKWFGTPTGLHLDSWMPLEFVDGYKVSLQEEKAEGAKRLYFVNLGAYLPGHFAEYHAAAFLVAENDQEVKARAKERLLIGHDSKHTDDLLDIDDCLAIDEVSGLFVHVEPTDEPERLEPINGYHIIPKALVRKFMGE